MLHCICLEEVPCSGAAEPFNFHLFPVGALLYFDIYEYILETNKLQRNEMNFAGSSTFHAHFSYVYLMF